MSVYVKSHRFPPTLILRILPLLRGFSVEIEATRADVHLLIIQIGLLRAVCATHIACERVILDLLAIGTKVTVALDEGAFENTPSAAEAVHKVNDIAGTDGEGGGPIIWDNSGTSRDDQHPFGAVLLAVVIDVKVVSTTPSCTEFHTCQAARPSFSRAGEPTLNVVYSTGAGG